MNKLISRLPFLGNVYKYDELNDYTPCGDENIHEFILYMQTELKKQLRAYDLRRSVYKKFWSPVPLKALLLLGEADRGYHFLTGSEADDRISCLIKVLEACSAEELTQAELDLFKSKSFELEIINSTWLQNAVIQWTNIPLSRKAFLSIVVKPGATQALLMRYRPELFESEEAFPILETAPMFTKALNYWRLDTNKIDPIRVIDVLTTHACSPQVLLPVYPSELRDAYKYVINAIDQSRESLEVTENIPDSWVIVARFSEPKVIEEFISWFEPNGRFAYALSEDFVEPCERRLEWGLYRD